MDPRKESRQSDWQHQHYKSVGSAYGDKHFTRADGPYTAWILQQIASVQPNARTIAELGAGTCVFASLLGEKMRVRSNVVCYEPVRELLAASSDYDNIEAVVGDAVDFADSDRDGAFDLVFTKDTAHHFPVDSLDQIHTGICRKLEPGGRYLMVVRSPPHDESVPVGSIARDRWEQVYTRLSRLLASLRGVPGWKEIEVTQWQLAVETDVGEWIDGVANRDTWSIFSALDDAEIAATIAELKAHFAGTESFDFLHQYDVAVFEKNRP